MVPMIETAPAGNGAFAVDGYALRCRSEGVTARRCTGSIPVRSAARTCPYPSTCRHRIAEPRYPVVRCRCRGPVRASDEGDKGTVCKNVSQKSHSLCGSESLEETPTRLEHGRQEEEIADQGEDKCQVRSTYRKAKPAASAENATTNVPAQRISVVATRAGPMRSRLRSMAASWRHAGSMAMPHVIGKEVDGVVDGDAEGDGQCENGRHLQSGTREIEVNLGPEDRQDVRDEGYQPRCARSGTPGR